jgi:hypothetical protein
MNRKEAPPVLASMLLLGRVAALMLVVLVGPASSDGAPREAGEAKPVQTERTRTGKERLGGKASDEQRVDDCKVPLDLRGPKPRPHDCGDGVSTRPKQ